MNVVPSSPQLLLGEHRLHKAIALGPHEINQEFMRLDRGLIVRILHPRAGETARLLDNLLEPCLEGRADGREFERAREFEGGAEVNVVESHLRFRSFASRK